MKQGRNHVTVTARVTRYRVTLLLCLRRGETVRT